MGTEIESTSLALYARYGTATNISATTVPEVPLFTFRDSRPSSRPRLPQGLGGVEKRWFRQHIADAQLTEQRDEERTARIEAQREAKQTDQARIEAERELAVAKAHTEAAQQQAAERATALEAERQARRDDAEAHKQALAEQRSEWKERLASIENQAQEARKQAQEAEKGRTKEQTRAEALAARLDALEARDAPTAKKRNADDQPTLPFDDQNPA